MHLTIVDDQPDILDLYDQMLSEEFQLKLIQNPEEAITFLTNNTTDLLLLDVNMPEMDGFSVYKRVKEKHPEIPVIFLTGDPSSDSLVKGLELGADDFIIKPISIDELVARVKNRIIKSKQDPKAKNKTIVIENLVLNIETQIAELDNKKIQLTPIEFKIIHLLSNKPNHIYSRDFLIQYIWPKTHVQNQNIDTHFSNLRKKLLSFSTKIKTIKSRGYLLDLERPSL